MLFRRSDREFEASFQIKDEILSLLKKRVITFADAGGSLSIIQEARVDGSGSLECYGTLLISFSEPLFSRVVKFEDYTLDYNRHMERCCKELHRTVKGPCAVREWQRIAGMRCAEQYLAKIRDLYCSIIESVGNGVGWLSKRCRVAEEVVILPGLYESARGRPGGYHYPYEWFGIIGGTIDLEKDRLYEYEQLLRDWLKSLERINVPYGCEYLNDEMCIILERDYRYLVVGDGYSKDEHMGLALNELKYFTKWWPVSSLDEMMYYFTKDKDPSAIHGVMNMRVPHYFSFLSVDDLVLKAWKGVKDTFINIYHSYSEGGFSGPRLNECRVLNVDPPADLAMAMFSCMIGRGLDLGGISKCIDLKNAAAGYQTIVSDGKGVWWSFADANGRNAMSIEAHEIVELVAHPELEIGVKVQIRYNGLRMATEEYTLQSALTVQLPTALRRRWKADGRYDTKLRYYELQGGPCELNYMCEWSVLFFSTLGEVPMREHGWQGEESLDSELEEQVKFLERYAFDGDRVCIGGRAYGTRASVIGRSCLDPVRDGLCVPQVDQEIFKINDSPESGIIVAAWIASLRMKFPGGVPHDFWVKDVGQRGDQRNQFGHFMLRVAEEIIRMPTKTSYLSQNTTLLMTAISAFTDIFGWKRRGWRIEELVIIWYGQGGVEMERICRRLGMKSFFALPQDITSYDGVRAAGIWSNKKANVVIANAHPENVKDKHYEHVLRELLNLGRNAEIYIQSTGYFTDAVIRTFWNDVDKKRVIDVFRVGAIRFCYNCYIMLAIHPTNVVHGGRTALTLDSLMGWIDGLKSRINTIPEMWNLKKRSAAQVLRDTLQGEFGMPGIFEMDVGALDLRDGLEFMGCISKSVRVQCFGRGSAKMFRLSCRSDIDRILRNMKLDGELIERITLDVAEAERRCRQLPIGRVSRTEATFSSVSIPVFLQSATNFVIYEWVRRVILANEDKYTLIDVGGRNGDLGGWLAIHDRIDYWVLDPDGFEPLPRGSRVMNGLNRAGWDISKSVDENVKQIIDDNPSITHINSKLILVFSNSLTAIFETSGSPDEAFQSFLKQVDECCHPVFIRDQYFPLDIRNPPLRRDAPMYVDPTICQGFHFLNSVGTFQIRYPNMPRLSIKDGTNLTRLHPWYPAYFENLYAATSRGFALNNFGRWIWPVASRFTLYLATKP
nr:MAG: VP3 [Shelly headland virus]